jgi:hypothetical protein
MIMKMAILLLKSVERAWVQNILECAWVQYITILVSKSSYMGVQNITGECAWVQYITPLSVIVCL